MVRTPCFTAESESRLVMSVSLRPRGLYSPWNSPGQNTGVGSRSFPQGIFPMQGLNPGIPHCRLILYQLSHQGSPVGSLRWLNTWHRERSFSICKWSVRSCHLAWIKCPRLNSSKYDCWPLQHFSTFLNMFPDTHVVSSKFSFFSCSQVVCILCNVSLFST